MLHHPSQVSNFSVEYQELVSPDFHFVSQIGAHDKLGMQVVPLKLLKPYEKKELTLDIVNSLNPNDPQNKKPRGQLMLEMSFIPFQEDSKKFSGPIGLHERNDSLSSLSDDISLRGAGLLLVTIIAAEDVEGKSHTNPYAVVVLRGEKRKTKVILTLSYMQLIIESDS